LTDTVLYKESLAAMTGGFGIPLNTPDGKTPADTRANIRNVGDAVNYLLKHHNHHLCIGHTHNPHSQPHFTLHNIGTGLPLIGNLIMALRAILPAPPNPNLFKSKYFNSGTCGWWESVLWAIEIGETGQAKLVFWTDRQTKPPDALLAPETMDWELTKWDPSLTKTVAEAIEEFRRFLGDKAVGLADEIEDALQTIGGYPSELFHIAVALGDQVWSNAEAQFREASLAAQNAVRDLQERIAELRTHTLAFVLTLQSRVLKFRTATQDSASFVFSFAGPDAFAAEGLDIARDKLKQYQDLLVPPGGDAVERARALIAYPLAEKFPRNIMPATNVNDLLNPVRRFMDSETPVLGVFSSVAAMFPTPGAVVKIGDQTITSELAFADGESKLKLTVTIRTDASAVHTPPAEPVS
jgi:hypothetical protein